MARGVWQSAVTVRAKETDHPAWHWLNARNLWRPEFPLPSCLRWLPASAHWSGRGQHTGAGSIVALVAPPWAWAEAWPGLPEPQSVELIAIKSNGTPALDRPANSGGLGKRTHGTKTGAVVVFGCPDLTLPMGPARVAEGVADALALASRYPGPAVATLGTSGMGDGELAEWLATCREGITIHADADEAGERKARPLRRQIIREAGAGQGRRRRRGRHRVSATARGLEKLRSILSISMPKRLVTSRAARHSLRAAGCP